MLIITIEIQGSMVSKCGTNRTKEEWQKIVSDFIPRKQTKKAYCKEKNIKYGSFKNWFYKLSPTADLVEESRTKSRLDELSQVTGKAPSNETNSSDKEFVGFKLAVPVTTIKLPNGISIEVTTGDIVELIKQLIDVA